MARSKKQYMYYRVSYSKKRDAFSTWVYVGDEEFPNWSDFGLEMECRCVKAYDDETAMPTSEANFVHFQIVTGIRQALKLGYKVSFSDRPED